MKLLIATDAWHPQINGVVRTLDNLARELAASGVTVSFLTPQDFWRIPCPAAKEIDLALALPAEVARRIEASEPDLVHVATEGPIGWGARRWCLRAKRPFTTSYHTRFPEYLEIRAGVPRAWTGAVLRTFHNAGNGCMVASPSLGRELRGLGFRRILHWPRGVDTGLFRRQDKAAAFAGLPRPISLSVGRVAPEKNLEAFLRLDLPGTKVVVGEGPMLANFRQKYPEVVFTGLATGERLAAFYAAADVFVFPSLTDTLGNVVLEALASGLPVAAFDVTGPRDILAGTGAGALSADLGEAVRKALAIPPERCREAALAQSWERSASQFIRNALAARRSAGRDLRLRAAARAKPAPST